MYNKRIRYKLLWHHEAMYRSPVGSSRNFSSPVSRYYNYGFRVVRPSPLA
ncbi:hypothetical protein [Prosthecochloris sp. ZM]|nr:hypothetical protein [Prosthecochloris sp. ZM]